MIKSLEIQNIALISKLSLHFDGGLTVLSGETGSGKSIIIDSLAFVLGERADKTMIKHGEDKAYVEVVFEVQEGRTTDVLQELGFDFDTTIIMSRTLTLAGKNECRVNGKTCSTSMLKQISATLVDIFGQSQHLNLIKVDNHIAVVDGFCEFGSNMAQLKELYADYLSINKQLAQFGGSAAERERMLDILKFQIDELNNANLDIAEEEELEREHKRVVNIEKIATALSSALAALADSEPSAVSNLSSARGFLSSIDKFDDNARILYERLNAVIIETDDITATLEQMLSDTDFNVAVVDKLEARIDKIRTIKRKYGGTVESALEFLTTATQQYETLLNATELIEKLTAEKEALTAKMYAISHKISAERKKTSQQFAARIMAELTELGMKGTTFVVDFLPAPTLEEYAKSVTPTGYDKLEFMFSANVGEPVKPLAKVISGGEMSRFMLAVKNITANIENIPTMVFDEIDTGISGNIARMVAIKLSVVSRLYQCIVITHLPQIVAMADCNLYITKSEQNGRTLSSVEYLTDMPAKAAEVSRLMGGVGQHSEMSAMEMIEWCNDHKRK
jgi:DNA repair protein RecN (Recombination protein N)